LSEGRRAMERERTQKSKEADSEREKLRKSEGASKRGSGIKGCH